VGVSDSTVLPLEGEARLTVSLGGATHPASKSMNKSRIFKQLRIFYPVSRILAKFIRIMMIRQ
jgi:hypothetical protein